MESLGQRVCAVLIFCRHCQIAHYRRCTNLYFCQQVLGFLLSNSLASTCYKIFSLLYQSDWWKMILHYTFNLSFLYHKWVRLSISSFLRIFILFFNSIHTSCPFFSTVSLYLNGFLAFSFILWKITLCGIDCVLPCYCCVMNYHKPSGLKQHKFFFKTIRRMFMLLWLSLSSVSDFYKLSFKGLTCMTRHTYDNFLLNNSESTE